MSLEVGSLFSSKCVRKAQEKSVKQTKEMFKNEKNKDKEIKNQTTSFDRNTIEKLERKHVVFREAEWYPAQMH